ncbi:hypothetical protein M885DRAFT_610911 [Pelagophyceae sp. CCMP2097]|nr:hypothetical protein M885DRAFT_610911 [Pelagophyceae sp. CCMP2097]
MSGFEELDEALLTPARRWYMANQMVEANPQVHGGLVARAAAFLAMGRPWEAVADLDRALRLLTHASCNDRKAGPDDDDAKIRLLRGHAHAACLSYDRAVADFAYAAEVFDEFAQQTGCGAVDASSGTTAAHARAGLGVCYCNMRQWDKAIESGERAIQDLEFDDAARSHVSRAIETARQHILLARGPGRSNGTPPAAAARTAGTPTQGCGGLASDAAPPRRGQVASTIDAHRETSAGHAGEESHTRPLSPERAAAAAVAHTDGGDGESDRKPPPHMRARGRPMHKRDYDVAAAAWHASQIAAAAARAAAAAPPQSQHRPQPSILDMHEILVPLRGEVPRRSAPGAGKSLSALASSLAATSGHAAAPGRESAHETRPKRSSSVASLAMSLSCASICSDHWELAADEPAPGAARRDSRDDSHDVGLDYDESPQAAAPGWRSPPAPRSAPPHHRKLHKRDIPPH